MQITPDLNAHTHGCSAKGAQKVPVTLVVGPPCAGKTTWVLQRQRPGDVVVDHDLIAQAIGSRSTHHHGQGVRNLAEHRIRVLLTEIEAGHHATAWVARTLGNRHKRAALAQRLNAEVIMLDPGIEVCRERARLRPNPEATICAINRWYTQDAATA